MQNHHPTLAPKIREMSQDASGDQRRGGRTGDQSSEIVKSPKNESNESIKARI
ncbi:MAG: hypothetical protein RBG13Loki_3599 [Promethearchaeota archaeon CR_4]|nr:MAG: hypothetical protein RBG13Loki_3599 [Candidatus Lokiarchaeota archaeon CR_4]